MKTNKGFAPIVIILIIIAVLAVGGMSYYAGKKNSVSESKNLAQVQSEDMQKYSDIVYPLFTKWLTDQGELLDYKINKITFIGTRNTTKEPEKFWFMADDTDNAFMVGVAYSVKPMPVPKGQTSKWYAGGGVPAEDGWINSGSFVTIDKNSQGYYIKRAGTGP
ncbi:MAG: hypothetical protein V4439_03710 [Patescibacteria group bacterium]